MVKASRARARARARARGGGAGRVPAKVRFEPPQVVQVLACPEQNERRTQLRLVTAGDGLAHAREEAAPALSVGNVRPRDRRAVDEGVAERDVPGAERIDLAVEVLAAALELRVAVGHPGECRERLGRAPHACRARDELPETLDVRATRRLL